MIYRWVQKFTAIGIVLFIELIRDPSRMPIRQPTQSNAEWVATVINASVYWLLVDVYYGFIKLFDLWNDISNPIIKLGVLFVGAMMLINLGWAIKQEQQIRRLTVYCERDGLPSAPIRGTKNRYRCKKGHQFYSDYHGIE
jgi:hypothetical protein